MTLVFGCVAALAVVGASAFESWSKDHAPLQSAPSPLADIPLIAAGTGEPTSLAAFKGQWVVLVFGYMTCPDVCPMSLAYLAREMPDLGPVKDRVRVVFVSVDPERDTPAALATYVHHFDPAFTAVTGTDPSLKAVSKSLGAYFAQEPAPDSAAGYLVTHASAFFVLDPLGRFVKTLPSPQERGAFAREMTRLAGAGAH